MARRLAAVPAEPAEQPAPRPPDLRVAVREAVGAMDWLTETDRALADLALRQAEEIEKAIDRAEEYAEVARLAQGDPDVYRRLRKLEAMCDVTKTVGWLGPQLQGVLRDLGGTPAARAAMRPDKPIGGRLAQLRAAAAGQHDS